MQYIRRATDYLYISLAFLVPLIFYTKTSELFEFNKMIAIYISTILLLALWSSRMILEKQVVFKRTSLDLPICMFLIALFLSTLVSIDPRTSWLGYYSRFHGGLVSYICYSLLYWGYVSNIDVGLNPKLIKVFLASTLIASLYTILEHFGHSISCLFVTGSFDVACWVQDVSFRPFATFGQPNWLAAWLAAVIPLTWALFNSSKKPHSTYYIFLSTIFLVALLFTKSRSGLLALGLSFIIYWSLTLWRSKSNTIPNLKQFVICCLVIVISVLAVGTPWTPSILSKLPENKAQVESPVSDEMQSGTVLEVGGSDSGVIRKIVWQGAFDLWKKYPILGTGVETFAHSYYETRPVEHNMVSEWNFLYNKAHNEYLNFLATTGIMGSTAYLVLIIFTLIQLFKSKNHGAALLAGYVSILVTNFFGFSVVPIGLAMFLFPAIAASSKPTADSRQQKTKISPPQTIAIITILLIAFYILHIIFNYWRADFLYTQGKKLEAAGDYKGAVESLTKSINLSKNEALFLDELGNAYKDLAVANLEASPEKAQEFATLSSTYAEMSIQASPRSVRILKSYANINSDLGKVDPKYYQKSVDSIEKLKVLAPTDPSVRYRESLVYARVGQIDRAIEKLNETIVLKPNYERAIILLGALYEDSGDLESAKREYQKALSLNPESPLAQEYLKNLGK